MTTDHLPAKRTEAREPIRPLDSGLVAAARMITAEKIGRSGPKASPWHAVAWDRYEQVGHLRYAAQYVGRSLSRARLVVARDPRGADQPEVIEPPTAEQLDEGAEPLSVYDRMAADLVADLGGSAAGQAQLLQRIGTHLFVPGESWLIGYDTADGERHWLALNTDELSKKSGNAGAYVINTGDDKIEVSVDDALVTRIWQPHPRRFWEADSPTRSAIRTLNKIVGLGAHVDATVDSRLAGAGLLVLPNSVSLAGTQDATTPEDDPDQAQDAFVAALIEAMVTPIQDRDNASAVVPLVIRVPDEVVDKVQHLTFNSPLDEHVGELEERAIRNLALEIDLPPEILLGLADSNHWCVDEQTEVLTRGRGWVTYDQVCVGDAIRVLDHETGLARWEPVLDMYVAEVTDEPMVSMESQTHSSLTTPNHRWPVVTRSGNRRWVTTETMTQGDSITTGAPADDLPTCAKFRDELVELLGWFWTEGNIRGRSVSIAQSHSRNPQRVDSIRRALTALFGPESETLRGTSEPAWREHRQANENSHGGPVTQFLLNQHASEPFLEHAPGKVVETGFIDALTAAQLRLFIDTSCRADGVHWRAGRRDVWQSDAERLGPLERAAILAGYATSSIPGHSDGWQVNAKQRTRTGPVKAAAQPSTGAIVEEVLHTGHIWCPVTPSGTWLARRDGKTFYTGNTAWAVDESTVKVHTEPMLALVCDAITIGYLRPMLEAAGCPTEEAEQYVCWFDTSQLIVRPNRSSDAMSLYDKGELSGDALRRYAGFDAADAPEAIAAVDPAVVKVLELVVAAPSLAQQPGLQQLLADVRALMGDGPAPVVVEEGSDEGGDDVMPDTAGDDPDDGLGAVA